MRALLLSLTLPLLIATACGGGGDDDDCAVPDELFESRPVGEDASTTGAADAGTTEPDADVACHCC